MFNFKFKLNHLIINNLNWYKAMQTTAYAPYSIETHYKISKVLDGDSFMVQNIFSKSEKQIRLYGLDAPESKRNKKLIQDEKNTRLAGGFLIELGRKSTAFVLTIAPPGTTVTLITEQQYFYDFYNRQLAYIILPDGSCLNEILVTEGYAKVMDKYYCSNLAKYQQLNFLAKQNGRGLYAFTSQY